MKKIALVTGARKGLGFAWCEELIREGYSVFLSARKLESAIAASKLIKGEIHPLELDIRNEASISKAVNTIDDQYGKLDLLVNNAGVNPKDNPDKAQMEASFYLDKLEADIILDTIKANSIAPMLMLKHFRTLLKKSDEPKVINISSWLGSVTNTAMGVHYAYCGSKNLLNMFNKIASVDLETDGIITITVNPGWVQTDMGGTKGKFTPQESVQNVINNMLEKITLEDSGKFYNYDGELHPW